MLSITEKKKLLNQILTSINEKLVTEENRRGGAADLLAEYLDRTRRQINGIIQEETTAWTKKKTEKRIWQFAREWGYSLPQELDERRNPIVKKAEEKKPIPPEQEVHEPQTIEDLARAMLGVLARYAPQINLRGVTEEVLSEHEVQHRKHPKR